MNLKEFMQNETYIRKDTVPAPIRREALCADGYIVSIQASEVHYCYPKVALLDRPHYSLELGFPSAADELITPYAEDKKSLTQTVYPYTPWTVVEDLVAKHGGIVGAVELPKTKKNRNQRRTK